MEELFDRWDVAAGQSNGGMPMHVTLMAPFVVAAPAAFKPFVESWAF
jgi:hypothetical protein